MPCLGVGSASEGGAASPQLADQRRGASACEPRGGKGDGAPIAMEALQLAAVLGRLFEIKVCAQKKRVILERETTGHWLPRLFIRITSSDTTPVAYEWVHYNLLLCSDGLITPCSSVVMDS